MLTKVHLQVNNAWNIFISETKYRESKKKLLRLNSSKNIHQLHLKVQV